MYKTEILLKTLAFCKRISIQLRKSEIANWGNITRINLVRVRPGSSRGESLMPQSGCA